VEERVADLHAAFLDPEVRAVFCTRGGYGAAMLLDRIDFALIRSHTKIFTRFQRYYGAAYGAFTSSREWSLFMGRRLLAGFSATIRWSTSNGRCSTRARWAF
jgi:hypothetical protein